MSNAHVEVYAKRRGGWIVCLLWNTRGRPQYVEPCRHPDRLPGLKACLRHAAAVLRKVNRHA